MSSATHIGRVGALAAALGIGAAMLSGPAVAVADRGPSESADTPTADTSDGTAPSTGTATQSRSHASRTPREPTPDPTAATATREITRSARGTTVDPEPAATTLPDAPRRGRGVNQQPAETPTAPTYSVGTSPAAAEVAAALPAPQAAPAPVTAPAAAVVQPMPVQSVTAAVESSSTTPAAGFPAVLADVADRVSAAITSVVAQLTRTLADSPFAPVESPAAWLLLAEARRQPAATATTVNAAANAVVSTGPTLFVLNGYNVVAASQKRVTSFYGPFVNFPAYPGTQSEQEFNLVDPATRTVAGSFKALQSTLAGIGVTRQLVVTDILSGAAGTAAGEIPPVGSVISSSDNLGFGTLYTAMPTPSGNQVSLKIVSPFGEIPLPFPYDAAKGLTDYVEVNKPVHLPGTDHYIAPTTPSTEKLTAVTGLQPFFTAIQGTQSYSVYDGAGAAVGSFTGLVTTTSDALGLYTKEILVSAVEKAGVNVPPAGTVYNLIGFTDSLYVLHTSTPGAKNSTKLVTPLGTIDLPLNFDAATPPPLKSLQVPGGGYKFVPTSSSPTVGVNGLPPREMITQGYQQFDVVDILGNKIGSVDVAITRQWDWFGGRSDAILITKVNSGTAGPLPWNVPPVGAVFNFRQPYGINLGFSDYYSSIPTILGDIVTYGTVTPFGLIPLYLPNYLSAGLADAKFVDPFAVTT